VHNKHVVEELRERGAIFVEEETEVPEGGTVVFSAHGVAPSVHANARVRDLKTIDATCPLVTKVHVEARKFAERGYTIVLVGHAGHEEVEGTMGEAPGSIVLIETVEDVDTLEVDDPEALFRDLPGELPVWMSHGDTVLEAPEGFRPLAHSANSAVAAMGDGLGRYGIQFHPEVIHTPQGSAILRNFLYGVAQLHGDWRPAAVIEEAVAAIRRQVGSGHVLCALSGGVDSAVCATLVHRAIPGQLTCLFVDNGLLRRDEGRRVEEVMHRHLGIPLRRADAEDAFLHALEGVVDPEEKRRKVGATFIAVFEAEARRLTGVDFLAQGTLYPDVIESTSHDTVGAQRIKTHHNVGGLPVDLRFELVEPLRYLFKDEVRAIGTALGLPEDMVHRQPFPGPGLSVRILGEVTRERLQTLRAADWIVVDEIKAAGLYRALWQSFAILTPLQSVGVMGDNRTYGNVVAIRAVVSDDGMTADWARLPYEVLARMASRIVNEVPGVNRVVYDVSSKPPSTIEWE